MSNNPPSVVAVVPVYRPDVVVLSRCLRCVMPQVRHVVVATEGNSVLPATFDDRLVTVSHTERKAIGFGANVNQGAAAAPPSEWLLILNDDVFLNDDAVAAMLAAASSTDRVGIVVHHLRYQDGRVFATVCARSPGDLDFHHVDQLAREPSLHAVCEVENACGASWLIRREAWDAVGGYDEGFFAYNEDNDLSLRVRQAGWRILYTPHAKGWHVGHQSMRQLGNLDDLIRPSARRFKVKWNDYLMANRYTVPGNFDYLQPAPRPAYATRK